MKSIDPVNDTTQTIICKNCGETLIGDEPAVETLCPLCEEVIQNAYPDGWECQVCEKIFYDEMPASNDYGTVCKNCAII